MKRHLCSEFYHLFVKIFLSFLLFISISNVTHAQSIGDLDTAFDSDGIAKAYAITAPHVTGMTVDSSGKILLVGNNVYDGYIDEFFVYHPPHDTDIGIVRFNTDGSLDTTFGTSGFIKDNITNSKSTTSPKILESSNHYIYVALDNDSTGDSDFTILRYTSSGTRDTAFGGGDGMITTDIGTATGGTANQIDTVSAAFMDDSDNLFVVGKTKISSTNYDVVIAKYNSVGTLDSSFGGGDGIITLDIATAIGTGSGSTDYGKDISLDSSGNIYVAIQSNFDVVVAKFLPNGDLDTTFNGTGIFLTDIASTIGATATYDFDYTNSLTLDDDGNIYVSGGSQFNFADYYLFVLKLKSNGSLDSSFGGGDGIFTNSVLNTVYTIESSVKTFADYIIVGGSFINDITPDSNFDAYRLTLTGEFDTRFSSDGIVSTDFGSNHIEVASAGSLIVNGDWLLIGGDSYSDQYSVARYILSICGNGEVEGSEECDDGNAIDEDDCSNNCIDQTPSGTGETGEPGEPDSDGDGIPDSKDNCPNTSNPDQKDTDKNGIGDACETSQSQQTTPGFEGKITGGVTGCGCDLKAKSPQGRYGFILFGLILFFLTGFLRLRTNRIQKR